MGFDADSARAALGRCAWDVNKAIDLLLSASAEMQNDGELRMSAGGAVPDINSPNVTEDPVPRTLEAGVGFAENRSSSASAAEDEKPVWDAHAFRFKVMQLDLESIRRLKRRLLLEHPQRHCLPATLRAAARP